jgi:hypothetical protein
MYVFEREVFTWGDKAFSILSVVGISPSRSSHNNKWPRGRPGLVANRRQVYFFYIMIWAGWRARMFPIDVLHVGIEFVIGREAFSFI